MDDEVIDISSSPEPENRKARIPQAKSKNQKNPGKAPVRVFDETELIEISSSEDDVPLKKPTVSRPKKAATSSKAGPSRPGPSRLFGAPRANLLQNVPGFSAPPVSSGHIALPSIPSIRDVPRQMPLFYPSPSDDDADHKPPMPLNLNRISNANDENIPRFPVQPEPVPKSPTPKLPVDHLDEYTVRVIEVIPDVQPTHVRTLLEEHIEAYKEGVVEFVLHKLFDNPGYPKIDKKGKRKRVEVSDGEGDERGEGKAKIDYAVKDRARTGGALYIDIAMEQLLLDFPYIPKPHVRKTFFLNNALYAPTYLFLVEEKKKLPLPYSLKAVPSRVTGKGKAKQDPEFDKEREWLLAKTLGDAGQNDAQMAEDMNEQEYEDCGDGIECGCCFSTYPFDKMIQCPDCHLFCSTCMTSYASNLLGSHDPAIVCMDQSGCKQPFPDSELRRLLTPQLLALYERVKQRKEIEAAGLANLEECPFCEYKVVIENEDEKLFRCEGDDCGAVSCRGCKKPDHLPKSCQEMEEDKHLDARHAIEEAMTRALMRNCPKCQKAFVKEHGCNKMKCPNCNTISCYICREVIVGYDHFGNPPPYTGREDLNKCALWDPVEQRHTEEVRKAALKALEEYKRTHPNMTEDELKALEVDLPPAAPAPVSGTAYAPGLPPQDIYGAHVHMEQILRAGMRGALPPGQRQVFNVNFNFGPAALPPNAPMFRAPPPIPVARPRRLAARRR